MNRYLRIRNKLLSIIGSSLALVMIVSCKGDSARSDYLPLIIELHNIECAQLNKHNVKYAVNTNNIYGFRSVAFDLLLTKNPDAPLIARYEVLCNKLADYERYLEEDDKEEYMKEYNKIYTSDCSGIVK
jgi:hypothetical protein